MKQGDVSLEMWDACREVIKGWEFSDFESEILAATAPAIQMISSDGSQVGPHASGPMRSRAGGFPDLPPHIQWPNVDGGLIPFIAQIDFAELPQLSARQFPASGMLYLFCWCTNEVTENPSRAIYYEGPSSDLALRQTGLDRILPDWRGIRVYDEVKTSEARLCLTVSRIVASRRAVASGRMAESEWSMLVDDLGDFSGGFWDDVRLLLSRKSRITLDWGWGTLLGYSKEHENLLPFEPFDGGFRDGDRKLTSLLQVPSINNMHWSDAGYLNFLIADEELLARNFDNVVVEVMSS